MQPDQFNIIYINRVSSTHPSEGLNVLLADLIKPLGERMVEVVVHTTDRHEPSLRRALSSNGVPESYVKIVRHRVGSMVLDFLSERRNKQKKPGRLAALGASLMRGARATVSALTQFGSWLVDMTPGNVLLKAPLLIAGILIALCAVVAVLPLMLIMAILGGLGVIFIRKTQSAARGLRGKQFRGRPLLKRVIRRLLNARWLIVNDLYEREQFRLAAAVNRRKRIQFLFIPWSFDGALVSKLKAKKIIVFPDAVTTLFPLRFPGETLGLALKGIKLSLASADGIVCYSNFVRDVQLSRFGELIRKGTQVRVIPQGYFPLPETPTPRSAAIATLNRKKQLARNLFPQLMSAPLVPDFSEFQYILYPTIDRPHKNTLVLAKALHNLVRERYRNVKLLLTTPALTSDVASYISAKRLHRDVIVMPSVPVDVLDALCAGAAVMVHPSLAEGGDIFNFSRAVSEGCPALMSDIPVVREMFDRAGVPADVYKPWLFEATDDILLAEKIDELLQSPTRTLSAQTAVLEKLGKYNFATMAERYHEFCKEIVNGH